MSAGSLRLGFVGLGQIGAPMANRWLDWDGGLTVFDVVPEATRSFADKGATVATSVGELASACDVVSLMVRDDAQVNEVVDQLLETAAPGTVVVVHSTVEAETPAAVAARCEQRGVHYLDAPVSGGFMGAHEGTLAFLIGGEAAAIEIARPALERQGTLLAHLGPVGAGTRAKIARNLITFATYVAIGEAVRLAEAAGVDIKTLGDVVRHSDRSTGGPGAIMVRDDGGVMGPDDPLRPIFEHTRALGEKDLSLAVALGKALGVDTPVAAWAEAHFAEAIGVPHEEDRR